jgi:hypothetical protein
MKERLLTVIFILMADFEYIIIGAAALNSTVEITP